MTYEKALVEKKEAEIELADSQSEVTLIIAPELIEDQERFMRFYTEDNYNDELCLLFSTNDEYTVLMNIRF